jgi:hypothetical protein
MLLFAAFLDSLAHSSGCSVILCCYLGRQKISKL